MNEQGTQTELLKNILQTLRDLVLSQSPNTLIDRSAQKSTDADLLYEAWAASGSATSAAVWKIKRIKQSTNLTEWADGNDAYDNIWGNREALTYS